MKVMNTLCLFTLKTILIGYRPQNYVNKQWVLHNLAVNLFSTSTIIYFEQVYISNWWFICSNITVHNS